MGRAAKRLGQLLRSTDERVALAAARSVLELGTRLREAVEWEERLTSLEERIKDMISKGTGQRFGLADNYRSFLPGEKNHE
jgi:hypothetical protein